MPVGPAAAGAQYGIYVCWCLAATAANSLGDTVNIRMNVSGSLHCVHSTHRYDIHANDCAVILMLSMRAVCMHVAA
jgi:hypothetical protein